MHCSLTEIRHYILKTVSTETDWNHLSHNSRKRTFYHAHQTQTQISLHIRTVLLESSCPHEETFHHWLSKLRPEKIPMRLRKCAVSSESSLGAHVRRFVFDVAAILMCNAREVSLCHMQTTNAQMSLGIQTRAFSFRRSVQSTIPGNECSEQTVQIY